MTTIKTVSTSVLPCIEYPPTVSPNFRPLRNSIHGADGEISVLRTRNLLVSKHVVVILSTSIHYLDLSGKLTKLLKMALFKKVIFQRWLSKRWFSKGDFPKSIQLFKTIKVIFHSYVNVYQRLVVLPPLIPVHDFLMMTASHEAGFFMNSMTSRASSSTANPWQRRPFPGLREISWLFERRWAPS